MRVPGPYRLCRPGRTGRGQSPTLGARARPQWSVLCDSVSSVPYPACSPSLGPALSSGVGLGGCSHHHTLRLWLQRPICLEHQIHPVTTPCRLVEAGPGLPAVPTGSQPTPECSISPTLGSTSLPSLSPPCAQSLL